MHIPEITLDDFINLQNTNVNFLVIDVREDWEVEKAPFKNALHIPLATLQKNLTKIPPTDLLITLCHHGVRSLKAAVILETFHRKALSLKGGIANYARLIDPSIPHY